MADSSTPAGPDFLLQDCLGYEHGKLDSKCVLIWPKIWHALREEDSPAASVGRQVLTKMIHNFSHVHQLHRLINKFLEALRSVQVENLSCSVTFPDILRRELEGSFSDTSEQQMSLILKILLADFADYVKASQNGMLHSSARTVVQFVWTAMRSVRVKTTTRQETLLLLFKQYFDVKDSVIRPLMEKNEDDESIYCAAVLTHAWSAFSLLFRDKYAVTLEDPLQVVDGVLRRLATCSDGRPELIYWRHRLILQRFTLSGEWML